jgi:predicted DNA-binding protein
MALEKKYDETPLQVLTDRETRSRIRHAAKKTGRSQAQVIRDILEVGLPMFEEMNGLGLYEGADSDDLGLE